MLGELVLIHMLGPQCRTAYIAEWTSHFMTPVGFEPTQLTLVELESTPLDHSGKVSLLVSLIDKGASRVMGKQDRARLSEILIEVPSSYFKANC